MLKTDFIEQMDRLDKHFESNDYEQECENYWNRFKNVNLAIFRRAIDIIIDNRKVKYFPRVADMRDAINTAPHTDSVSRQHYPAQECDCRVCKEIKNIEKGLCRWCGSDKIHPKDADRCILCHVRSKYYYCLCEYCEKARKIEKEIQELDVEIEDLPF